MTDPAAIPSRDGEHLLGSCRQYLTILWFVPAGREPGWYWQVKVASSDGFLTGSWHGPYSTDHAAYDAAISGDDT